MSTENTVTGDLPGFVIADPDTGEPDLIGQFLPPYRWLSNFWKTPLAWEGLTFPTAEHAYQAGKTTDREKRMEIALLPSAREAKRAGRALTLRPGWDEGICCQVMDEVLEAKFTGPWLRDRFLATGDSLLIEGNYWHDRHWGDCYCKKHREQPGGNLLGLALMRLRRRLSGTPDDRWVRVAATGHRPHKLPAGSRDWVRGELDRVAAKLHDVHGMRVAISGGAMGTDLWWADSGAAAGASVWMYRPHPEQAAAWNRMWKNYHDRVAGSASRVVTLGDKFGGPLLHARNELLIRDCDALVAVLDPDAAPSGTGSTVAKALSPGRVPVIRIDPRNRTTTLTRASTG